MRKIDGASVRPQGPIVIGTPGQSPTRKYDLAIYIGRFQPFHAGHLYAIEQAMKHAHHVMILVGSSNQPRTPKNPWTFDERVSMIHRALGKERFNNPYELPEIVGVYPLTDYKYDDTQWAAQVQSLVDRRRPVELTRHKAACKIAIVGHDKDESSYYLKMFPHWDFVDLGYYSIHESKCMDATRIRELMFEDELAFVRGVVPDGVFDFITDWKNLRGEEYRTIKHDYEYIKEYKRQWVAAPYPPTFVTADAVVIQSGHVLMIRRGHSPGVGCFALPGGFVGSNERVVDAAMRELVEETSIAVQEKILRRSIVTTEVFDAPNRSLRGRTITHATLFKLDDATPLPRVKAGDDANLAWWVSLGDIDAHRDKMFEDHYDIIKHLIGKLPKDR